VAGSKPRGLALPFCAEPGRSLVARAGVAVYRVGAVKRTGERTWSCWMAAWPIIPPRPV